IATFNSPEGKRYVLCLPTGAQIVETMKIRTKLLLTMAGLLVLSGGLSLALQLWDGHQLREEVSKLVEDAVRHVVDRVVEERAPGGFLAEDASRRELRTSGWWTREAFEPQITRVGDHYHVIFKQTIEASWAGEDLDRPPPAVIPSTALEENLLGTFRDPVVNVLGQRLPRQLLISGSVLLAGLVLVGVLGGRLSKPIRS